MNSSFFYKFWPVGCAIGFVAGIGYNEYKLNQKKLFKEPNKLEMLTGLDKMPPDTMPPDTIYLPVKNDTVSFDTFTKEAKVLCEKQVKNLKKLR